MQHVPSDVGDGQTVLMVTAAALMMSHPLHTNPLRAANTFDQNVDRLGQVGVPDPRASGLGVPTWDKLLTTFKSVGESD